MKNNDQLVIGIAAISQDGMIADGEGKEKSPWEDRKNFAKITMKLSSKVIMGSKTAELIPSKFFPLMYRHNIVLRRGDGEREIIQDPEFPKLTYMLSCDPEEVLSYGKPDDINFIIGGSQIYELFLPYYTHMILTHLPINIGKDGVPFLSSKRPIWDMLQLKPISLIPDVVETKMMPIKPTEDVPYHELLVQAYEVVKYPWLDS